MPLRRSRAEMTMELATPIPPTSSATPARRRKSEEKVLCVARSAAKASGGRLTWTCPGCSGNTVAGSTLRTSWRDLLFKTVLQESVRAQVIPCCPRGCPPSGRGSSSSGRHPFSVGGSGRREAPCRTIRRARWVRQCGRSRFRTSLAGSSWYGREHRRTRPRRWPPVCGPRCRKADLHERRQLIPSSHPFS